MYQKKRILRLKEKCTFNKVFNIATPFPLKPKKNEPTPNPHFKALPFLKGIEETPPPKNPRRQQPSHCSTTRRAATSASICGVFFVGCVTLQEPFGDHKCGRRMDAMSVYFCVYLNIYIYIYIHKCNPIDLYIYIHMLMCGMHFSM